MFYIFDFYTFLQICIALILTVFLWMYFMIDDADGSKYINTEMPISMILLCKSVKY